MPDGHPQDISLGTFLMYFKHAVLAYKFLVNLTFSHLKRSDGKKLKIKLQTEGG